MTNETRNHNSSATREHVHGKLRPMDEEPTALDVFNRRFTAIVCVAAVLIFGYGMAHGLL